MYHLLLPVLFLLSPPLTSSQSPFPSLTQDFGRIIFQAPNAVLEPKTPSDIASLINSISSSPAADNNTVAPRGAGHSAYGQAQAPGGTVVDMRALPNPIQVVQSCSTGGACYVDAGGGALWVDVLAETLKQGLTPRSWTDYLYLTVGGTLSVAGISGQAFKHGPQIVNVLELDVITGKGEQLTCSNEQNPELFYGVLGGLGQLGIITRARIPLQPAPKMVKRVSIAYDDFDRFTSDEELMISSGEVDYLEGFVNIKHGVSGGSNVGYSMEFAIYYDDVGAAQKILDRVLSRLNVEARSTVVATDSTVVATDSPYFNFLNRVKADEDKLRRKGLWEVPHPWLNLFVPRAQIGKLKDLLLLTIPANNTGPIILYPILLDKWNPKMSAVLPQAAAGDSVVYAVNLLRSAPPSCTIGTPCLNALLQQNQKIIDAATASMGAKQYIPFYHNEEEWRAHFGGEWERFQGLKARFDPLNMLAPGQRIFKRKGV